MNKVEKRVFHREWRKNNKESVKASNRKFRKNNPEKVKKAQKEWREKNKEKVKKTQKAWYSKNRENQILKAKEWGERNPERVKEIKNKWKRKYRKSERYQLDKEKKRIQDYAYRNFRDLLIKKFGGCQMCGEKNNLEVHHKEYNNDLNSVMLLCRNCHREIHRGIKNA